MSVMKCPAESSHFYCNATLTAPLYPGDPVARAPFASCGEKGGLSSLVASELALMRGSRNNVCSFNIEGTSSNYTPHAWGMSIKASVSDGLNAFCRRAGGQEL